MKQQKVFVLDYDVVSPLGVGKSNVLSSLQNNVIAETPISRFITDGLDNKIACEIKEDLSGYYKNEHPRILKAISYDRKLELAVTGYYLMEDRLKKLFEQVAPERSGVIMGIGADIFSVELLEKDIIEYLQHSDDPLFEIIYKYNKTKGNINILVNPFDVTSIFFAHKLKLGAFQKSVLTACAASTQAILLGCEAIRHNEADMVIAGGTDSIITTLSFISFSKLGILAPANDQIGKTCKPFDINRSGTIAGESAGLCVIAGEELVKKSGIEPKFEILGYGNTLDAYKITSPDPSGRGMMRSVADALQNSGVFSGDIDYINLHGTGTHLNDPVELKSLKDVFGETLENIPVSSTKDRHGHAIAAAGIQEFSILCLCMENNFIPCNINLEKPIMEQGIDLVHSVNRKRIINIGMTNNFGFGGVNTSLIIKKL